MFWCIQPDYYQAARAAWFLSFDFHFGSSKLDSLGYIWNEVRQGTWIVRFFLMMRRVWREPSNTPSQANQTRWRNAATTKPSRARARSLRMQCLNMANLFPFLILLSLNMLRAMAMFVRCVFGLLFVLFGFFYLLFLSCLICCFAVLSACFFSRWLSVVTDSQMAIRAQRTKCDLLVIDWVLALGTQSYLPIFPYMSTWSAMASFYNIFFFSIWTAKPKNSNLMELVLLHF